MQAYAALLANRSAAGLPHAPAGTEAEFGSGFCYSYNQVHLSWKARSIVGIFYVNDTLSPALLRPDANGTRAKRLADETKLLPRAARAAAGATGERCALPSRGATRRAASTTGRHSQRRSDGHPIVGTRAPTSHASRTLRGLTCAICSALRPASVAARTAMCVSAPPSAIHNTQARSPRTSAATDLRRLCQPSALTGEASAAAARRRR